MEKINQKVYYGTDFYSHIRYGILSHDRVKLTVANNTETNNRIKKIFTDALDEPVIFRPKNKRIIFYIYNLGFNYLGLEKKVVFCEQLHHSYIKNSIHIFRNDASTINLFQNLDIDHNVSKIEFALDLFTKERIDLLNDIRSEMFLGWSRKNIDISFEDTFYIGDPRNTKSQGLRVYIKRFDQNQESVRIEIEFKRNFLKAKGINTIEDLSEVREKIDIPSIIRLKSLNVDLLKNRIKKDIAKKYRTNKEVNQEELVDQILNDEIGKFNDLSSRTNAHVAEQDLSSRWGKKLFTESDENMNLAKIFERAYYVHELKEVIIDKDL